ncbi:MAG: rhomboid family intramembrane serine protease [Microthrixaceae bacterium]
MDPSATCYRHPNNAAAVGCQRCDRPVCPTCMTSASVGFHCPECLKSGAQRTVPIRRADDPIATKVIIGLNVAAFVASVIASGNLRGTRAWLTFADNTASVAAGEWWRVITGAFLHDGVFHLGMNMLFIWVFGSALEARLGKGGLIALYSAGVLGGALGVVWLSDPYGITVGASGAGFALMGALVVLQMTQGVNLWSSGLGGLVLLNVIITFAFRGSISVGGHLGGFAAGLLAGAVLFAAPRSQLPRTARVALVGAGAVFLFGLTIASASAKVGAI